MNKTYTILQAIKAQMTNVKKIMRENVQPDVPTK